jgi:hypothetical protein
MNKTYIRLFVDLQVNGLKPRGEDPVPDPAPITVTIYFGVRLQDMLLKNPEFYKLLGFKTVEDIDAETQGSPLKITKLKLSSQSDACRLGLLRELKFSIVPVDPTKQLNPYNSKYNTSVFVKLKLDTQEVVKKMYAIVFTLGTGGDATQYKILGGSIQEKKAKKTTPTYY